MNTVLANEFCFFEYDIERKQIHGGDKTDHNNEPRCFSRNVRPLKKGWIALLARFTEKTTEWEASNILTEQNVSMHHYCAVD